MIPSRRRSHKRRLHKRRVTIAVLTVAILAGIPAFWQIISGISNSNPPGNDGGGSIQTASLNLTGRDRFRPVYKYSVVSGGVQSAAELAEAAQRDPVVRDHYQDIRLNSVKALRLDKDMLAYVSYRVNDKILWTQKKVRVSTGELVLTDGKNLVRGRCGNRISVSKVAVSPGPVPPDPEFDLDGLRDSLLALSKPPVDWESGQRDVIPYVPLVVPPAAAPDAPLGVVSNSVATPQLAASHHWLPLLIPAAAVVGSSIGELSSNHSNKVVQPVARPVTVAPEPSGYVWLLGIGLGLLLIRSRRRRIQRAQ